MKGLFIPEITAEMFRSGCLESIEALMAEGELYDIDYPLEQEPCEDCISKKEAVNALRQSLYNYEDKTEKQFLDNNDLDVSDWFIHRIFVQNMNDADVKAINDLPPVQPEPKAGHWKRVSMDKYTESAKYWYRCDKCGEKNLGNTNFCPNCGAKMSETPTGSESEE